MEANKSEQFLTSDLVSQLTGAPKSALDMTGVKNYPSNQSTDASDIYIEGTIVTAGSFLDGFEGFVSPKAIRRQLQEADNKVINLFIDSPGGSVYGASNILTEIIKLRKQGRTINAVVTGLCASAATFFLLQVDNSSIAPTGSVMLHRVSASAYGNWKDMEAVIEVLKQYDEQYIEQIAEKTGKSLESLEDVIDKETWLTAKDAVDFGLVDDIYSVEDDDVQNKTKLHNSIELTLMQLSNFKF